MMMVLQASLTFWEVTDVFRYGITSSRNPYLVMIKGDLNAVLR